ncbi:MAG: DUF3025 domain-containing protein [Hylemonella sp.]|uniref:DUF3025 domain-containing protein n=1 Tax=Hylemonella sp. TaxID=2066020 RepID=UPI00391A1FC8
MDVDWSAPWLQPYRAVGQPLADQVREGRGHAEVLDAAGGPLRFVPQSALPEGWAYERYIFETRQVPTRDGLHDFFNGLVWLHFPQTKRQLNALQAAAIAADGIGPVRGPLRDALTLFDENAALLQVPDRLWEALCARDWRCLFVEQRPLWQQVRVTLFGHALIEKLVQPRKDITAHVYRVPLDVAPESLDVWLAGALVPERLARKPFQPLPVLGVPGWWPANETPAFYDDAQVFRPRRAPGPASG